MNFFYKYMEKKLNYYVEIKEKDFKKINNKPISPNSVGLKHSVRHREERNQSLKLFENILLYFCNSK